jgi:hypothetical protein
MDYQTLERLTENLFSDVSAWFAADPITHGLYVIGGIAVLGAINGIRLSLNHCKGRTGRIL